MNENGLFFVSNTGILGKRKSECFYQESNLRCSDLILESCTSDDALPLSYRSLVGAKAIKLVSWYKHPACMCGNYAQWNKRDKCDERRCRRIVYFLSGLWQT